MTLTITQSKVRRLVCALCLSSLLLSISFPKRAGITAQGGQTPPRPRSNHETQIKVPCGAGTSVNTWNGNLFYPIPLLPIPGRGLSVDLTLSYNSSWHGFATRVGHGMQLNYQMFYSRDESGNINVAWGDGRMDRFTKVAEGYVSPADTYDTLREHLPGRYALRTKGGLEFFFDSPVHKRLTTVKEPNGNALSFSYDSDMRMTLVTDTAGRQLQLAYSGDRLTSVTDNNITPGRSIRFQYDPADNLSSMTNAEGNTTRLSYDGEHFLTRISPSLGAPVDIAYSDGSVVRISSDVSAKSFSYDATNLATTLTEVAGNDRVTRFVYDSGGRISRVERSKDSAGTVVSQRFSWDAGNNLVSSIDEKGRMTKYAYNERGDLTTVTDALGHVTSYTYENVFERLTSVIDPNGHKTSYEYDARGNVVREVNALNEIVTYAYDARGDRVSRTDAKGHMTLLSYDAAGNRVTLTNPLGHTSSSTYDGIGNPLTNTTPNGFTAKREYDLMSRLTSETNPLGERTSYVYDALGNVTQVTDAEGNAVTYKYDALNRLLSITNASGQQTKYSYNPVGNLTSITDAAGHITTFTYDRLNRRVGETDPLGHIAAFGYDEAGNLTSRTDANGVTTLYTYNSLDQLIGIDYPGTEQDVDYAYDAAGNRTLARNSRVTVNYAFDALNRMASISWTLSGISKAVSYSYDAAGNRVTMTDPDGGMTKYEYDASDRLTTLTGPSDDKTLFAYDKDDHLIRRALANGTFAAYAYNQASRLLQITNRRSDDAVLSSYAYQYDHVGNRTRMTEPGGSITTYGYDRLYRLTGVSYPEGDTQSYSYDSVGNRLTLSTPGGLTAYTYDAADRLLSAGTTTYTWDANGNLTARTNAGAKTTYKYDFENQLSAVTYPDSSTNSFTYYPEGTRLSKTDRSGQTTRFFHDGSNVLLETNQGGSTLVRYTSSGLDGWISRTRGGTTVFYQQDGLASTTELTDADQSVVATYRYDSYGALRTASGNIDNPYQFTGREHDAESELYYHRARMYDPLTGRFNSKDPILDNADPHLFKYVKDNPVNWKDPKGKSLNLYEPWQGPWFYNYGGPGNNGWDVAPANQLDAAYRLHDLSYPDSAGLGSIWNAIANIGLLPADYQLARDAWRSIGNNHSISADALAILTSQIFDAIALHKEVAKDVINSVTRSISAGGTASSGSDSPLDFVLRDLGNPGTKVEKCPCNVPDLPPEDRNPFGTAGLDLASLLSNVMAAKGGSNDGPYNSGGVPQWPVGGDIVHSSGGGAAGSESRPLRVAPSAFLERGGESLLHPQSAPPGALVNLSDILPTTGPAGTVHTPANPRDLTNGTTNAVEVLGEDFVEPSSSRALATVFAAKTLSTTYEHDYTVCNRFHDYTLETAAALPLPEVLPGAGSPRFWYASTTKGELVEEAFIFDVFVDESQKKFTVDSRWLTDNYPTPATPAHDYIFNFQIWAPSSEEAYKLVRRTLLNLSNFAPGWTVAFANTADPPAPNVLIKTAEVTTGNSIRMTVQSWQSQPLDVQFFGSFRQPNDRANGVEFQFQRTLQPGFNVIELPVGPMIDAVVFVSVNGFLDKVYVGSGFWFSYDNAADGGGSKATITELDCPPAMNITSRDLALIGCTRLTGRVDINGFAGMARTLNPNGRPIDISSYRALTFFAKGDGKSYRVNLETDSVRQQDSTDFHQFVFTTSADWRQFVIPLTRFAQQGWDPTKLVTFTGQDVKTVSFSAVGDPLDSIDLTVDRLAFTNSTLVSNTTVLPHTTNTVGPYFVNSKIVDDVAVRTVSLAYSLNGSPVFTRVPMTANGDIYGAQIPGQPLGSEIRYYVEATDGDGNMATDPVDTPLTAYTFQISANPYVLVEDYADTNPANRLGGNTFLFGRDSGSTIEALYDKESLKLTYDVSSKNSYAGYSTLLSRANLLPYNAVSFLVKGGSGRERVKVGLRDSAGNEPKIILSEYLAPGVTTSWRKVTIPFAAFTKITDWSHIESFVIAVENSIGSAKGEIYFDDVKFESTNYILPIVVDNFNDMTSENGLGGTLWTSNGGAGVSANYEPGNGVGEGNAGYRITYTGVTNTAWAAAGFDTLGLNAVKYQSLSFDFRGARGDERPNVYLASRTGGLETRRFVDLEKYIHPSTGWQRVKIPLGDFASPGVDLSNVAYVEFVFEFEDMAGTIFLDNVTFQAADNPNDNAGFYVRQHYVDFLNREPDLNGFNFWANEITSCGSDQGCIDVKRINVSAAFYLSIEFQDTGYLVQRIYKAAYGDAVGTSTFKGTHQISVPIVRLNEFLPDTQEIAQGVVVNQGNWQQQLENNKQAFTAAFVQRARFAMAFPDSMTPEQFVDQLNSNAGNVLSATERATAIGLFGSATNTNNLAARARVLRQVAEDPDLNSAEFNRAFVLMQYFGYLRRNPNDPQDTDYSGYDFWLTKLNQFNGNFVGAEMVKAFIASVEYRQRFGP